MTGEIYKRCRLCAYVIENLIPMKLDLIRRIRLLFQLRIDDCENYTKNICLNCLNNVDTAWSFFEKITEAQRVFYKISIETQKRIFLNEPHKIMRDMQIANLEDTVIFNEISIIPIDISIVPNKVISEDHNHSNVISDIITEDPLKHNVETTNPSKLKSGLLEESTKDMTRGPSNQYEDYPSSTEKCSYNRKLLNKWSDFCETGPVIAALKRKRKIRNNRIFSNRQSTKGTKKGNLHLKQAKGEGFKSTSHKKTKERNTRRSQNIKKITRAYHLDPSDVWPDYPWICNICSEQCTDMDDYKNHPCFQLHKRFFCADCPKTLVRPEQFFQHISEFHWERFRQHLSLQCDECQRWFPTLEIQEEHRRDEHPNAPPRLPLPESHQKNPYQCDQCDKDCKTRSQLTNHLKIHSKDKRHTCDVCGKAYFYPSSLLQHKKLHNKSRDFICEQCGRGFYNKGTLKAHKQTHLDINERELPFACSVCSKRFANRCKLRYHEMVHTGAKPFVCEICGRNFRLRDSLKGHVTIVHSESKTHFCNCCDMKFKTATNLSAHMRQHTGEHPYACTECSKTFSNYSNCDKHMKRIHNLTLKGRVNLAKICATLRKETEGV